MAGCAGEARLAGVAGFAGAGEGAGDDFECGVKF